LPLNLASLHAATNRNKIEEVKNEDDLQVMAQKGLRFLSVFVNNQTVDKDQEYQI